MTDLLEPSFEARNSRVNVTNPVDPSASSFAKTQDMRQCLQQKMVDLGTLQSTWGTRETELTEYCESLITNLKDIKREIAVEKASRRARHLRTIDQMIKTHQEEVMRLQSQINEEIQNNDDVDETIALDADIQNLRTQIKCLENEPVPEYDVTVPRGEDRTSDLEDRISELQQLIEDAVRQREDDSRQGTKMLQDIIQRNKQIDAQNQKDILKCIEELNKLEKSHAEQVQKAKSDAKEVTKQLTDSVRKANANAAKLQTNITLKQKEKKRQMKAVMAQAALLRSELQSITERQQGHMEESTEIARNCQKERHEYIALQKELEMLNCELARETVDHETLMKNLSKIDDMVINRMGRF